MEKDSNYYLRKFDEILELITEDAGEYMDIGLLIILKQLFSEVLALSQDKSKR